MERFNLISITRHEVIKSTAMQPVLQLKNFWIRIDTTWHLCQTIQLTRIHTQQQRCKHRCTNNSIDHLNRCHPNITKGIQIRRTVARLMTRANYLKAVSQLHSSSQQCANQVVSQAILTHCQSQHLPSISDLREMSPNAIIKRQTLRIGISRVPQKMSNPVPQKSPKASRILSSQMSSFRRRQL